MKEPFNSLSALISGKSSSLPRVCFLSLLFCSFTDPRWCLLVNYRHIPNPPGATPEQLPKALGSVMLQLLLTQDCKIALRRCCCTPAPCSP